MGRETEMSVSTGVKLNPVAVASGSVHGYTTEQMFRDEEIWRVADRLRGDLVTDTFGGMYVRRIKKETGIADARRIRYVLDRPELWSPFVDMIAVDRAVEFDWRAIEALTVRESMILARLLYLRGDDFEEMGHTHRDHLPVRTLRWRTSTPHQRRYVISLVRRFGDSEVARAALATLGNH